MCSRATAVRNLIDISEGHQTVNFEVHLCQVVLHCRPEIHYRFNDFDILPQKQNISYGISNFDLFLVMCCAVDSSRFVQRQNKQFLKTLYWKGF